MAILTTTLAIDANDLSRTEWRIVARQCKGDMTWHWMGGMCWRDVRDLMVCTGPSEDGREYWLYAKHWRTGAPRKRTHVMPQSHRGFGWAPRRTLELV